MTQRGTVFISFAKADTAWAKAIAGELRDSDFVVLTKPSELGEGDDWLSGVRSSLDEASVVLVIVSANSAGSRYVQFETGAALAAAERADTRVVPIYLSPRGESYFPLLKSFQGLDLTGLRPEDAGKRVAKLLETTE